MLTAVVSPGLETYKDSAISYRWEFRQEQIVCIMICIQLLLISSSAVEDNGLVGIHMHTKQSDCCRYVQHLFQSTTKLTAQAIPIV